MPPKTPRQSGISPSTASTPNLPTYSFGDIVLAKVKGHPAWPARIVDPHASPMNLRDERKIAQKNSYLVKFFKTADYAWMNAKEMSVLGPADIRAFIDNPNKKGADLKAAYQIALAPEAWEAELEAYQQEIDEQQKALEIDELEPDADAAAKPVPLKPKQKRKRVSEPKTPVVSAKKRKSEVVRSINGSAKTSPTPEPAAPVTAVKKAAKKKKEEPAAPIDGEAIVREWRHKLQRLFLGKAPLTEKMMPEIAEVFNDIESFEMKAEWLHSSKLAKVLKRVGVLGDANVPLDAEYNIRARSRALQDKWRLAFGFPEDSSNRAQVTEANQDGKSDSLPAKADEPAAPSEPIDVDPAANTTKEASESITPNDHTMDIDHPPKSLDAVVDDNAKTDVPNDSAKADVPEANEKVNEDSGKTDVQADSDKTEEAHDESEKMDVQDESGKTEEVHDECGKAEVNGDSDKPEDVQEEPEKADPQPPSAQPSPRPEAPSVEVNGNHPESHSKEVDEKSGAVEDVEMAPAVASNAEVPVIAEKPQAQEEKEDEGEQMDCADSPEPTTVASNEAENKDKLASSEK